MFNSTSCSNFPSPQSLVRFLQFCPTTLIDLVPDDISGKISIEDHFEIAICSRDVDSSNDNLRGIISINNENLTSKGI